MSTLRLIFPLRTLVFPDSPETRLPAWRGLAGLTAVLARHAVVDALRLQTRGQTQCKGANFRERSQSDANSRRVSSSAPRDDELAMRHVEHELASDPLTGTGWLDLELDWSCPDMDWRIHTCEGVGRSLVRGETQLPPSGVPVSQASRRTRSRASAVRTCWRWVLARPR